jgi:YceI-like domain
MKKIISTLFLISCLQCFAQSQVFFTKNGLVSFYSSAPIENIKADNNQVISIINTASGEMQFSLLVKAFHFKKSLMEEHFNENYMESKKYPKATFKGRITDLAKVNFATDGTYSVAVSGDLTIHGVTNKINAAGTITVKGGAISAHSKFPVRLADHKIEIPKIVRDNIAKVVEVTVSCTYDKKNN